MVNTCVEGSNLDDMRKDINDIKEDIGRLKINALSGIRKEDLEKKLTKHEERLISIESEIVDMKLTNADLRTTMNLTFDKMNLSFDRMDEFMQDQKKEKYAIYIAVVGIIISALAKMIGVV